MKPFEFDCDSAREITVWDCRARVALFHSTNGASWQEQAGMLDALPSGGFDPDLAILDHIVASLEIQPQ